MDDNRDYADSVVLLLSLIGMEARACYDGPTALAVNERFRPGLCFLDLNMPGMDGVELAERLTRSTVWRPLLLVAVTAMGNEASRARVQAAPFHLHLVKPVDPGRLIEVAGNQVARYWSVPQF